jgi:ABC-2 type transport system ATP-binding protein
VLRVRGLDVDRIGGIALEERVVLTEMTQERGDLQQVFLELTGEGQA